MTCLIWRQHRGQALWTVITVTALCALMVSFGLSAEHWLAGYHTWLRQLAAAGCPPPDAHSGVFHVRSAATCGALKDRYPGSLQAAFASHYSFAILFSQDGLPAAFAIIGAMIGAPLVAREVEQRTQLAAWTQSVSRRRWYITKIAALTAALAVAGLPGQPTPGCSTTNTTGPRFAAPSGSWVLGSGTGVPVPYHPASQYWPLQLILLTVLLAAAAAALASGWRATRTRAV